MRRLVASLFVSVTLVATSLVFVPGAGARNGGASCYYLSNVSNGYVSWDTPAYYNQSGNSELHYCD
jgi:hypothetical protein